MLDIRQNGNLYSITFSHPDRDQFNLLVECMKEIGAEWDRQTKSWILVEKKRADILLKCKAFSGTPSALLESIRKEKAALLGLPPLNGPKAPEGISLMPHQEEGVGFIEQREGSLIAWEVGVGKSGVSIASINAAGPQGFPALIICPAHLKHNWYKELKGDPELNKKGWLIDKSRTVGIASGSYFPPTDVVIINYDILDRHKEKLDSIPWAFAIIDESHFCKNPKAKRTKAIIGGSRGRGKDKHQWKPLHAKRRIALSGTPLVNKPEDLWAVCNWLDPKRWPSKYWFESQFCTTSKRKQWTKRKVVKDGITTYVPTEVSIREVLPPSRDQMDKLNKRLTGTIMSRIRSKDVLNLPPLIRRVIEVDVAGDSIRAERKTLEGNRERVATLRAALEVAKATGDDIAYAQAIRELTDFQRQEQEHVAVLRKKIAMEKVPYVVDHVRNILLDPDRKVLVFAHHHCVIEALYEAFSEIYPNGVVHFYGSSTPDEKKVAENRIQHDPSCRIFIGGITAAGTGLTLTGAQHVVFAEEDWVPSNMRQCEGRCIMEGQPVMTPSGWVPIENIRAGDFVIGRNGRMAMVEDAWSRGNTKPVVELEVIGWPDKIVTTADHEFLIGGRWVRAENLRVLDRIEFPCSFAPDDAKSMPFPQWARTDNSFVTDCGELAWNGRKRHAPDRIDFTDDALFSFGYFVGDGWTSISDGGSSKVAFCGHVKKDKENLAAVARWIESVGGRSKLSKPRRNCVATYLYSKEWALWFRHEFGHLAKNKKLPQWVFEELSTRQKGIVLSGLAASDGYQRKGHNRVEYVTASEKLAFDVFRLAADCGHYPAFSRNKNKGKSHFVVAWGADRADTGKIVGIYKRPPRKINGVRERVYDLTVKDQHSFVVGPAVVHNCWRKGQTQSVLVEHIVAYGSIDALIAKRMIAKQEISDQAIDAGLTLDEPIDWIEDHRIPTPVELEKEVSPYQRTAYGYGLSKLVANPRHYNVTDLHLLIASRLAGRELTGKAAAYARWLCKTYLGASDDEPVKLPDRSF